MMKLTQQERTRRVMDALLAATTREELHTISQGDITDEKDNSALPTLIGEWIVAHREALVRAEALGVPDLLELIFAFNAPGAYLLYIDVLASDTPANLAHTIAVQRLRMVTFEGGVEQFQRGITALKKRLEVWEQEGPSDALSIGYQALSAFPTDEAAALLTNTLPHPLVAIASGAQMGVLNWITSGRHPPFPEPFRKSCWTWLECALHETPPQGGVLTNIWEDPRVQWDMRYWLLAELSTREELKATVAHLGTAFRGEKDGLSGGSANRAFRKLFKREGEVIYPLAREVLTEEQFGRFKKEAET